MLKRLGLLIALALGLLAPAWSQTETQLNNFGSAPVFNLTSPSNGQCLTYQSSTKMWINAACSGGSTAFNNIAAGTNTAALLMGTGGTLGVSGSGTITATSLTALTGLPSIANNTVLGNSSGSSAAPSAQTSPSISGSYNITGLNGLSFPFGDNTSVAIGAGAMALDATANERSVAIGLNAMGSFTGCTVTPASPFDIAIGSLALNVDSGCENTAIGIHALQANTTGQFNVGIGNDVMEGVTTGSVNTAFGHAACGGASQSVVALTGNGNVCLGDLSAGYLDGAAAHNTFAGEFSGGNNTAAHNTAIQNTGLGYFALQNVTTGGNSVAVGAYTLGGNSGVNETGGFNVGIGSHAGWMVSGAGVGNVLVGYSAASALTSGSNNIVIGPNTALTNLTTGSSNIIIGNTIDSLASGTTNEINIGGLLFYNNASVAAPVVSACGTSPAIDSHANNKSGTVTVGTVAAASCTVTFAGSGYTTWNHCRVTSQSTIASFAYSYTKTVLTVTGTSLVGDLFDYDCDGY